MTSPFAELLRGLRDRIELTQEELAERAGISSDAVSLLERGERRRPHTDTVVRLAAALKLSASERTQFEAAARRSTPRGAPTASPQLPTAPTKLVGRADAIEGVIGMLSQPTMRLVTLTGPGGVGKTRLALAVAERMSHMFADGVVFVPLATLRTSDMVSGAIATALKLRDRPGQPIQQQLIQALQSRQTLVVLDNFEHLLAAAPLVSELLAACPRLVVLTTSRAPLHIAGEQQFAVAPLALSNATQATTLETLKQLPAVLLFQQRAQAIVPSFAVTTANGETIRAICRRLDGLPLAIELAAAWIKLLPPPMLLQRLKHALPLLVGGPRDLPERQQTLYATIGWSYDLLPSRAQTVLRRLAVCLGGFSLAAAEAIGATDEHSVATVLADLAGLVDASLLQLDADDRLVWAERDVPRYTMLEVVREFAFERLTAGGEHVSAQRQHANYFLQLAETLAPNVAGADEVATLAQLEDEHANLRAALQWALDQHDVATAARFAVALWRFWAVRSHLSEGRAWMEAILSQINTSKEALLLPTEHATLLQITANLTRTQSDYARATALYEAALSIRRELDDANGIASCLHSLGIVAYEQGDLVRSIQLYTEALALMRGLGDAYSVAFVLASLGDALGAQGDLGDVEQLYAESLELFRGLGHSWGVAYVLTAVGDLAQKQGDSAKAIARYKESLNLHIHIGHTLGVATCLARFAWQASAQGQPEQTVRLLGAAAALREHIGAPPTTADARADDHALAEARMVLGEAMFERTWQAGCAVPLAQIAREALSLFEAQERDNHGT